MKRCMFIGQAMPRKKSSLFDWPSLNSWLYSIELTNPQIEKYFFYSALVNYFPGSVNGLHNIPTKEEIGKEQKRLASMIKIFNPEITVPVGRLSISYCLDQKTQPLKKVVGKIYTKDPYLALGREIPIIPLPHPSGASTWYNKPDNKKLLSRSLELLKNTLVT